MKYRRTKDDVIVEGFQWTGKTQQLPEWVSEAFERDLLSIEEDPSENLYMEMNTPKGKRIARPDDFLVNIPDDGIYPYKSENFLKTHEAEE